MRRTAVAMSATGSDKRAVSEHDET